LRPPTCGVTVTDSKAAFLPISSKYFGTSCAVALTTVTSGAGIAGAAACTLLRLQPAVANRSAAASPSRPYRRFEVVLTVMFMAILNNLKSERVLDLRRRRQTLTN